MNRLNRYLLLDICATTIALLALTGTVAALSMTSAAQAQFSSTPGTLPFPLSHSK